jgi:hypothetical protein
MDDCIILLLMVAVAAGVIHAIMPEPLVVPHGRMLLPVMVGAPLFVTPETAAPRT